MKNPLPYILATITQHPRQLFRWNDIVWSEKSWTHNTFRFYEYIFGRRDGIKAEMSAYADETGRVYYACHSWESVVALTETKIREALAWRPFRNLVPVKLWIPILWTPEGVPVFASPYLFAIAFDAASASIQQSATTPLTYSFTVTGSNPLVTAGGLWDPNTLALSSIAYAGSGLTTISGGDATLGETIALGQLAGCATGANNMVISTTSNPTNIIRGGSTSYSGCKQTGQPDSSSGPTWTTQNSPTVVTTSTTVVASNCWLVNHTINGVGAPIADTGATLRVNSGGFGFGIFDSNGTVGTGSQSLSHHVASGFTNYREGNIIISIAPFVAAATASPAFLVRMVNAA